MGADPVCGRRSLVGWPSAVHRVLSLVGPRVRTRRVHEADAARAALLERGGEGAPTRPHITGPASDGRARGGARRFIVAPPTDDAGVLQPAQLPPREAARAMSWCVARTVALLVRRQVHQPRRNVGLRLCFADGTSTVAYRETVVARGPAAEPALLLVRFRLRHVRRERAHALFRLESELNTILFAGFPGLISKLWFRADEQGRYRGLYEWDDPALAVGYARALSAVLALVSEAGSVDWVVIAGATRSDVSSLCSSAGGSPPAAWWLPVPRTATA